jgi:hypothetical protein
VLVLVLLPSVLRLLASGTAHLEGLPPHTCGVYVIHTMWDVQAWQRLYAVFLEDRQVVSTPATW